MERVMCAIRTRIVLIWMGLTLASAGMVRADDWPQWLGPQRDGVWRETGIVEKFPASGPPVKWRTPIGEGYSGPAVSQGKVVITDRILAKGATNPDDPFSKNKRVDGTERVVCLDEATGKILWKHEYECPYQLSYAAGPRTTPVIAGGKVYALGAMGDLFCLDLNSGNVVWSKNLAKEYKMDVQLWGYSGHPLVDGDRLICLVGGKGSTAVAFNKDTGKEIWRALSAKDPGYAPPMIYEIDGKRQLIIWHPESVNSLDPVTGNLYWTQQYGKRKFIKANLTIPTPRIDGDRLFLTAFYDGPLMLRCQGHRHACDPVGRQGPQRKSRRNGRPAQHHEHAILQGRLHLRRVQLRRAALSQGRHRRTGLVVAAGHRRQIDPLGPRVSRPARRPLHSVQRTRRSDHRQADAEGL